VLGRFNDDFMLAYPVHFPEKTVLFSPDKASFRKQSRKLVGHGPNPPTGTVGWSAPVSHHLRRGHLFIPVAKGTIRFIRWKGKGHTLFHKIMGAFGPLGGNNHPLFSGRILSQFGHGTTLFDKNSRSVGLNIRKTKWYVKKKNNFKI
jgi:hypothetical protein